MAEMKTLNGYEIVDAKAREDVSKLSDEIGDLKQNTPSAESVLTIAQVNALDGMFKKCAFTSDATTEYEAFKTAFGITGGGTVEPEEPEEPDTPEEPDVPVVTTYTITNNLTNVSTDNPVATVTENSGYTAILTPDTDFVFDSVTVTMGGIDVTSDVYTDGAIVITAVTGNIVITAIASEPQSEEVTLLKSITGDGASWIDTEFILEDSTHTIEISAKLDEEVKTGVFALFGSDGYNVGTPYGSTTLLNQVNNERYLSGTLNQGQFSSLGTWNTNASSLTTFQFYVVLSDGSQKIYKDVEHTSQYGDAKAVNYGTYKEFVPIPMYLFKTNTTENASKKYTPCRSTIYFFKITNANGEVVLNLVPAKQGGKIGMYDTVTQKFHENIGTGTFAYEKQEVA